MDSMAGFRLDEAERLVRWIRGNREHWESVINGNRIRDGRRFADLLQALNEAELYQIIVVLLALNDTDEDRLMCMNEIEQMKWEIIAEAWNRDTIRQLTDGIIDQIRCAADDERGENG